MTERPLVLRYAARSHVGLVRAKNDDSAYAGKYLAVVADGMGGHAGGDVASASTVLDLIHLDRDGYLGDAGTHLADEIQTANSLLSELVHVNPKLAGMGTTVTALLLSDDVLAYAHIGDSRAYRLKDGVFEQLSTDHTFVQRMIDEGRMTAAEAEVHPHKNVLMRVLGDVDASPELDLKTFDASVGERWLLCSDGLNFVRPEMIEDVVRNTRDLGHCADTLIELTLAAGSPDNVTVVVFDIVVDSPDDTSTAALETITAVAPAGAEPDGPLEVKHDAGARQGANVTDLVGDLPDSEPDHEKAGEPGTEDTGDIGAHIRAAVVRHELASRPHELVGAAVTANADGKIPALAGHPATRRAATMLTHKPKGGDLPPAEPTPTGWFERRRRLVLSVVGAAVLVAVIAASWISYAWTQTQYYVGVSNGHVAIFNGVSQSLGPISLSHVYEQTAVVVTSLPEYSQQRLQQTLPAQGLPDARQIISDLQLGVGSSTPPCNFLTATPTPTGTATTKPTAKATSTPKATVAPKATPKPTATGKPTAALVPGSTTTSTPTCTEAAR
ncbi:PP2C family protein-serine/threonine phosphatase [Specibacter cremeus]|uniref:PP2C family protein-serine/threonine phosphatase n=1 Tax=Specibacter cremeus TaxID=1629051 RepID=UPI000F77FC27|nr:protein phosphatase 2C domain-containing protein [Specibacter cremeus]